ncbi:DUF4854 domain-containing protein [Ruminococcus sp.]|uniref:DUF4854 domain-containing protein n=1 Tax=Ruminococcus sp. TaxID=41978 RepID=UPI0038684E98
MKRIICVLLIALLCLGLAACSPKQNPTESTSDPASSAVSQTDAAQSASASSSGKQYATVKEYLDRPDVQSQINSTIESNKSDEMEMSIYAEGDDTLVYDYLFAQTYDENGVAELKTGLDKALEEKGSTFTSVAGTLKTYVEVENPKVKVVYRNGDNTVITEKTFE